MSHDQLIIRLVADLEPVRRRNAAVDTLAVAVLCGLELAVFLDAGMARPDLSTAIGSPPFWWKLGSCGLIALSATGTAIVSLYPVESPRRGLRRLLVIAASSAAGGWLVGAAPAGTPTLAARLSWPTGIRCVTTIVVLSLPPALGLGLLMRRGAATEPGGTALAVGAAAAAWAAFVFAFACPYDDPLYVAVWYGVGCGLVALLARLALPSLTRW